MAPSDYLRVLRARWWVIALLVLVGTSVAWLTTPTKAPTAPPVAEFRATTVLVKGSSATGDTTDASNLALASSLVGSNLLIERTATELGRPAAEVATDLAVAVNDKAGTLQISSVDTDPALAMREADVLAAQLVTFLAQRHQQQLEPLITTTNDRISELETRVKTQDTQLAPLGSPQADLQRAGRDSLIRQLSASYDRLQLLTVQLASVGNELVVLAPAAAVPTIEIPPDAGFSAPDSPAARAAIGFVVGLLVGLALVLGFERMNPKLRTTAQAEEAFGLPVIAEIPRQSRRRGTIATFSEPHSVAAESYRSLRTALMYTPRANGAETDAADRFEGGHVVLVTSAANREGKTTVVANLAAGFAEKVDDVVVLSGDARQPAIESVLLGRAAIGAKLARKGQSDTVFTMIPGVTLALSGDPITNPADLVNHEREIVRRARSRSQIVLVDTPPALVANDATELMHGADSVVLVARCGTTSLASARKLAELVARQHVRVVGVVLIGADVAVAGDSTYYRMRPRRSALRELRRLDRTTAALVGKPVPEVAPLRPPPNLDPAEALPAEPVDALVSTPDGPVDDGGIWRPKTVIDLKGFDETRKAEHAHKGQRGRLPLFRSGDTTNGAPPR